MSKSKDDVLTPELLEKYIQEMMDTSRRYSMFSKIFPNLIISPMERTQVEGELREYNISYEVVE